MRTLLTARTTTSRHASGTRNTRTVAAVRRRAVVKTAPAAAGAGRGGGRDADRLLEVQGLVGALMATHLCSAAARARFAASPQAACREAARSFTVGDCADAREVMDGAAPSDLDAARALFGAFLRQGGFPHDGEPPKDGTTL